MSHAGRQPDVRTALRDIPVSLAFDIARPAARVRFGHAVVAEQTRQAGLTVVVDLEDALVPAIFEHLQESPKDAVVVVGPQSRQVPLNPFLGLRSESAGRRAVGACLEAFELLLDRQLAPAPKAVATLALAVAATQSKPSPLLAVELVERPDLAGHAADGAVGPAGPRRMASLLADAAVVAAVRTFFEEACTRLGQTTLLPLFAAVAGTRSLGEVILTSRITGIVVTDFISDGAARRCLLRLLAHHLDALATAPDPTEAEPPVPSLYLFGPTGADIDALAPHLVRLDHAGCALCFDTSRVLRCDGRSLGLLASRAGAVCDRRALPPDHPLVHAGLVPELRPERSANRKESVLFHFKAGQRSPRGVDLPAIPAASLAYARLRRATALRYGAATSACREQVEHVLGAATRRRQRRERGAVVDRALEEEGLLQGFLRVRRAGGGPGSDGISSEQFEADLEQRLRRLRVEAIGGTYRPQPLFRVEVPKRSGGTRPLAVAAVRDRILQSALAGPLSSLLDPLLLPCVYGYRPGIGPQSAIAAARTARLRGAAWAAHLDIERCFDTVDHRLLWSDVQDVLLHDVGLRLLRQWLRQWQAFQPERQPLGLAQGSPLSPVLLNLYLRAVDEQMASCGVHYFRYADDILLLGQDEGDVQRAAHYLERLLATQRRLTLNPSKTATAGPDAPIAFLGILLYRDVCRIPADRLAEFRERVGATLESRDPLEQRLQALNMLVEGWGNYYRVVGHGVELDLATLDDWLGATIETFCAHEGIPAGGAQAMFRRLPRPAPSLRGPVPPGPAYLGARRPPPSASGRPPGLPETFDPLEEYAEPESETLPDRSEGRFFSSVGELRRRQRETERAAVQQDDTWIRVHGHGVYLTRYGDVLVAKQKGTVVFEAPLAGIEAIHVLSYGVTLSNYLLQRLADDGKAVLLADPSGRAHGVIAAVPDGNHVRLRRRQAAFYETDEARELAAAILGAKIENQRRVLLYYGKYRRRADPERASRLEEAAAALASCSRSLRRKETVPSRDALFSTEAVGARAYWLGVERLLRGRHAFPGRVKRGAADLVNVMLNYGYAVLAGEVWRACTAAGLDPAFGFLHGSRGDTTGLVYDLMEEFRAPVVDRTVLSLLLRGGRLALNRDRDLRVRSRNLLLAHLNAQWMRKVQQDGRRLTFRQLVWQQAKSFRTHVEDGRPYAPFRMRW